VHQADVHDRAGAELLLAGLQKPFPAVELLKMTLRGRRGKSPLAIESIDDRYCRAPRGVML
jgi:hypothetical protein